MSSRDRTRIRVLRLCSVFEPPPSALVGKGVKFDPIGGMQNHTAELTRALDRRGVVRQVEVVVEHFLGRAATEVLHDVILLHIAEHADHQDVGTPTSTVHTKMGYSPECVAG